MRVYVAGPISLGDQYLNVRHAIDAADQLRRAGHTPFVPHLCFAWHMVHPWPYESWMEYDAEWLRACEALVRIPGESSGADREVAMARQLGMPVYFGVEEFLDAMASPNVTEEERAA